MRDTQLQPATMVKPDAFESLTFKADGNQPGLPVLQEVAAPFAFHEFHPAV